MPQLIPVDNDPFAAIAPKQPQLVPVDYDPFAASQASAEQPKTQPQAPVNTPENTQKPGMVENIGNDLNKRYNQLMGIVGRSGTENPLSTGLQGQGAIRGAVADVVGDVGKAAYGALPDVGGFKEKIAGGIQKVSASPLGQIALEAAKKGGIEYAGWAKDHPEAARNVEALVDIGSFFPAKAAAKVAGKAAGAGVVADVAKGVMSPGKEKMASITDSMHKQATSTIEKAKKSGISYSPNHVESMVEALNKISQLSTAGERTGEKKTVDLLDKLKDSVLGPLVKDTSGNMVRDSAKADMSLRNLYGFSKSLGEISDESSARAAKKIIDAAIGDSKGVVAGNPKDAGLVAEFKKQWGRYKTGEDVVAAAELASKSAAKSRNAFQKIVDSDYFSSLSPEVQKLTKVAAKGKTSGKFLDVVGSLKNLLGAKIPVVGKHVPLLEAAAAVASGHLATATAIGAVMGAGAAGKQIQRGTAVDVLRAIREGK